MNGSLIGVCGSAEISRVKGLALIFPLSLGFWVCIEEGFDVVECCEGPAA